MLELKIDHIGATGDGVAYADGTPFYVPFTAEGDIIRAEKKEKRGNGFSAEMTELVVPSPNRTKPPCRHFGTCGGCALQHVDTELLASWKRTRILEALKRAGITEDVTVNPTKTSPSHSRRRVEFVASKRKKGVMIGYHLKRSHQIFDVGDCPLLVPELMALVKPLRALLPPIMPRNSQARLTLTSTMNGPDLLITGDFPLDLPSRELLASFSQQHGLCRLSVNNERDKLLEIVAAIKPAIIAIGDEQVIIPPGGFLQATAEGQDALVSMVMQTLPENANTLDLFAGCGSFSMPAARTAKKVHAIEGDEELVFALQNAANKHMLPITTEYRDLFRRPLTPVELNKYDVLIIDPPRAGAQAQAAEIAQSDIETILFISCNPTTFARDVKILLEEGYELKDVTPVDQFLWSSHVELFAVLKRNKAS